MNTKLKEKSFGFLLITLLLFALLGCALKQPVNLMIKQLDEQKYKEALQTMRNEVKKPQKKSNKYLAYIYHHAIYALYHYADFHGVKPGMDDEALHYYQKAMEYAKKDEWRQDRINNAMQNYYSWTLRNGLAVPYVKKQIEYAEKNNKTYDIFLSYSSLAGCYHDMGELALRDHYRLKALSIAKDYFIMGVRPKKSEQWLQYERVLFSRMDNIAGQKKVEEILNLWNIAEPIVKKYIFPEYISYLQVAEYLAISGENEKAKIYLEKAKTIGKKEHKKLSKQGRGWVLDIDLSCTSAHIYWRNQQYKLAVESWEKCLHLKRKQKFEVSLNDYRLAALANESAENLEKAIQYFRKSISKAEKMRSSYSVSQRATFFRGISRRSYWGLIRCLTKRYLKTKSKKDFDDAVVGSELVRGRQFGDLIRKTDVITNINEIRSMLGSDEIMLNYIAMKKTIVLYAFTNTSQRALILPYNRHDLSLSNF